MKKTIILALMALALVAVPASAQTRKDKKAAEKARWEQQQRQEAEISEMRHDIRKANLASEQASMAAQVEAQKQAEERAKQKAIEKAAQEVVVEMPCGEYLSTHEYIRALGTGEDYDQQFAIDIARTEALYELASQINTRVQAIQSKYNKSSRTSGKTPSRESISRIEQMINTSVDESTGYRIICRKSTSYVLDGEKLYKGYVAIEIDADAILKPLYEEMQAEAELEIDADYENFKEEFNQTFNE